MKCCIKILVVLHKSQIKLKLQVFLNDDFVLLLQETKKRELESSACKVERWLVNTEKHFRKISNDQLVCNYSDTTKCNIYLNVIIFYISV